MKEEVLPAMVPELRYENLAIQDGGAASTALEVLLLDHESLTEDQRRKVRHDLLEHCKLDTLGMVRLLDQLRELVGRP